MPFVRGRCRQALEHLRIDRPVVEGTTVALTEACANVVQHAGPHAECEVSVDIAGDICRITVVDDGSGFDPGEVAGREPSVDGGGAGLTLMDALVDHLDFRSDPPDPAAPLRTAGRPGRPAARAGRWPRPR